MKDKTNWYIIGAFVLGAIFGVFIVGATYRGTSGMWSDMMHGTTYYGTQYQGEHGMMNYSGN